MEIFQVQKNEEIKLVVEQVVQENSKVFVVKIINYLKVIIEEEEEAKVDLLL